MNAAEDAAATSVPRLLIADWMMMFADEKTQDWRLAGIPILRIFFNVGQSILSFFSSNFADVLVFLKQNRRIMLLNMFEMTVAAATPSTVLCRNSTKNMFIPTLTRPEITSAIKGILVLPIPLNIAASKLYWSY